jgi:hypothetical protein
MGMVILQGGRRGHAKIAAVGTIEVAPGIERGRVGYDKYRHDFAKLIWHLASPKWNFDDATFDRSAPAFDKPDHVAIVIHN